MRILFVDDHVIVREGIARLIEATLESTVIEASSPEEALNLVATGEPPIDVVLLDLEFPGRVGTHPITLFRSQHPSLPILVLSSHDNQKTVRDSSMLGATGFIGKKSTLPQLVSAIHMTLAGLPFVPVSGSDQQRVEAHRRHPNAADPDDELMRLLVEGLLDKQIADRMGMSVSSVRHRLTALYHRLGCRGRTEAVARIMQRDRADRATHP